MNNEKFSKVEFHSELGKQAEDSENTRAEIYEKLEEAREIAADMEKELAEIESDNEFARAEGYTETSQEVIDRLRQNLAEVQGQIDIMESMAVTVTEQTKKLKNLEARANKLLLDLPTDKKN